MAAVVAATEGPRAGPSSLSSKKASKASKSSRTKTSKRPPVGKLLGATDKEVREKAVEDLLDFLAGAPSEEEGSTDQAADNNDEKHEHEHESIDEEQWESVKLPKAFREEEMLVLWQGCFYCMYMCDKPLPQQKLAGQLAEPVLSIAKNRQLKTRTARVKAAVTYLSTFWMTIVRELPNIDKYRMDKYYALMRMVLRASIRLLSEVQWDSKVVAEVHDILTREEGPLRLQDVKTPISIAYHVIDIYLDEVEKALTPDSTQEDAQDDDSTDDATKPATLAPVITLLQPFIDALTKINTKVTFQRVIENVFDPLIEAIQARKATADEQEPSAKRRKTDLDGPAFENLLRGQPEDLDQQILKRLFEEGAKESTEDVNRKRLYSYATRKGYEGDE